MEDGKYLVDFQGKQIPIGAKDNTEYVPGD
jgi:hypothetical protein